MTIFARYDFNGEIAFGIVENQTIKEISQCPLLDYNETGITRNLKDVKLLSPVTPSKIIAIGLNYKSHLEGREAPKAPEPFLKAPNTDRN